MFVGLIFALFGQVRGSAMRAYHRGGTSQQQTKIISAEKVTILTFYWFDLFRWGRSSVWRWPPFEELFSRKVDPRKVLPDANACLDGFLKVYPGSATATIRFNNTVFSNGAGISHLDFWEKSEKVLPKSEKVLPKSEKKLPKRAAAKCGKWKGCNRIRFWAINLDPNDFV